jgi:hypothetical protein
MKESDWYSCNDIRELLNYLRNKVSMRKLRLFAVACCRGIESLLPHEMCRTALTIAERMAEGEGVRGEQRELDSSLYQMYLDRPSEVVDQEGAANLAIRWCMRADNWDVPQLASYWIRHVVGSNAIRNSPRPDIESVWNQAMQEEEERQIHLLRDIIGYRSVD